MGLGLLFIFFLGLSVGSFLAAVEARFSLQSGKKNWSRILGLKDFGRSRCDACARPLSWWENVPLVSFLLLRRRCRTCRSPIPWRYPLIELLTGLVFAGAVWWADGSLIGRTYGSAPTAMAAAGMVLYYWALASVLVLLLLYDARHRIIPDRLVLLLLVLALPLAVAAGLKGRVLAGLVSSAFLLLLHLVTRGRGMGLGDVKFAFFMGFFLGWQKVILAFYLAFLLGAVFGLGLILAKRKKMKDKIAFGPFLVLALFAGWFWGKIILTFFQKALF